MEIAQIERNGTIEFGRVAEELQNEEFVCANCGYSAINRESYAYHAKLCAIPA